LRKLLLVLPIIKVILPNNIATIDLLSEVQCIRASKPTLKYALLDIFSESDRVESASTEKCRPEWTGPQRVHVYEKDEGNILNLFCLAHVLRAWAQN
jgi:hypothetical protein